MTASPGDAGKPKRRRSGATNRDRTARSHETEARLLDCALTVFAAKGYDGASVRDIIGAAGVTEPTLYYYSEGKLDLFRRIVRTSYGDSLRQLKSSIESIPGNIERLRTIILSSFHYCAIDLRIPRLMFQTAYGPRIDGVTDLIDELSAERFAIVRGVIEAAMATGELAPSHLDGVTLAFCCLMDQHINVLIRLPQGPQMLNPLLANWLLDLFLRGAGPKPTPPAPS